MITAIIVVHAIVMQALAMSLQDKVMCDFAAAMQVPGAIGWACRLQIPIVSVCKWSGVSCQGANVSDIVLFNKRVTGSLPQTIGNLLRLGKLSLAINLMRGTIPSTIGALTSLYSLSLTINKMEGTIPTAIGYMTGLTYLGLSTGNKLSGPIPSSITLLTNLVFLDLFGNKITGTIPSDIGKLSSITYLGLFYNKITGSIPDSLGSITNVTYINLAGNQLTGSIPSTLCNLQTPYIFLENNPFSCYADCISSTAFIFDENIGPCGSSKSESCDRKSSVSELNV